MENEQIRATETPAADLAEIVRQYKDKRRLLEFEQRQVTRLNRQGKQAEAAEAQRRVDAMSATVDALRETLKAAHMNGNGRKLPEERMLKAEDANYIRA